MYDNWLVWLSQHLLWLFLQISGWLFHGYDADGKGKLKYTPNGKQKYIGNGKQKYTIESEENSFFLETPVGF